MRLLKNYMLVIEIFVNKIKWSMATEWYILKHKLKKLI